MFGKSWTNFWKAFEKLMEDIPSWVSGESSEITIDNNNISINGNFKSLKINGFTIKVPSGVMKRRK